jgi:hypothetical protein
LEAAYLFYYASDAAFVEGSEVDNNLKKRLEALVGDALIIANQAKFDVFNALTLMDNCSFLESLKVCILFIKGTWPVLMFCGSSALGTVSSIFTCITGEQRLWQVSQPPMV